SLVLGPQCLHTVAEKLGCLLLLPAHLGERAALLGGQVVLDVQVGAEVAEQEVELAVAVVVGHGDLRADSRSWILAGFQELAVADPIVLLDQGARAFELWPAARANVAVPVDAPVGGAGDDVPAAVAVPVGDDRVGMLAAGHAERLGADLDPLVPGGVGGGGATPLVAAGGGHAGRRAGPGVPAAVRGAVERADQDVQIAVVVPIDQRHPAPERFDPLLLVRDLEDRLATAVLDHGRGGEGPSALAAEEVELPGIIRAGDQVERAVAVEVHELWTGPDTSVDRYLGIFPARTEVHRRGVSRGPAGPQVAIEPEQPAEVADDEVPRAVAVDILDPRTRVPPRGPAVDDPVGGREARRRLEHVGGDPRRLVVRRVVGDFLLSPQRGPDRQDRGRQSGPLKSNHRSLPPHLASEVRASRGVRRLQASRSLADRTSRRSFGQLSEIIPRLATRPGCGDRRPVAL